MTNKVAYDYIKYLLGWSRDKKKMRNGTGFLPYGELVSDPGVGQSMAKAALGNRGFMSRMKQKIFAGGQSNNVISVAFQMADPNDGWTLVNEKGQEIEGAEGDKEGEEGKGKEGADGKNATGKGAEGKGADGKGNVPGASGNGKDGGTGAGQKLTDKDVEKIKTLLQRVIDLEKNVFGKEQGNGKEEGDKKNVAESTEKRRMEKLADGILFTYLEDSI